nr:MAG TPA: hypothetical protein [Caudoviricetes sp.]
MKTAMSMVIVKRYQTLVNIQMVVDSTYYHNTIQESYRIRRNCHLT